MSKHIENEIEKVKDPAAKLIGEYILSQHQNIDEAKTLKGCMDEIHKKAKSQAVGGIAMVEDAKVFAWALEYFGLNRAAGCTRRPEKETQENKPFSGLDFQLEDLL